MMQIKVRAWDNVANEMHYAGEDVDLIFILGSEGIECTDIREMGSNGEGMNEMEHLIYMLYTGQRDPNGIPIYDGDIFSFYHEDNLADTKEVSVVTWFGDGEWEYPAFDLDGSKLKEHRFEGNALHEIITSGFYKYEVIGNIYEHPHLLEGGETNAS